MHKLTVEATATNRLGPAAKLLGTAGKIMTDTPFRW
ncbi:hypothetical protein MT49_0307 [Mycobacterium tuberculosis 49-02]|uniref:Uncharacterized protein n=1 Tax=Mycobacterium tuberculosis (strain CDC 1551 / Oshkosh) TaxID=83331 RepID=Q8VKN5_MYCTO|nr:hypothetical protein MT0294 [Mycobacterium tuberculosis CDC1551]CDM08475.1 hypothetical protein MT49_0307 [Mycobacterium tuberculosis 49-02]